MLSYNLHTHTKRCQHAVGEDRAYVEQAIQAGMKLFGFSDHVPYPFKNGYESYMRMPMAELEGYVDSLIRLRKEYEKDIKILIGFEAEYFPELFDELLDSFKPYPIDYLIMGQHFLNIEAPGNYIGNPFSDEGRLKSYISQVIEGLSTGCFTYLAHPDLPYFTGDAGAYETQMARLCCYAKAHHIPVEVNVLGAAEGRHYPNETFIRTAKAAGCDFVLGWDSHNPNVFTDAEYIEKVNRSIRRFDVSFLPEVKIADFQSKRRG